METITDSQPAIEFASIEYQGRSLSIEYSRVGTRLAAPLIIFLHEGLGSLRSWKHFPSQLCARLGCRGVVYSRCGYGNSSGSWAGDTWPISFMHVEARELLPRFLTAIGLDVESDPPVLFGHSDGGSIALIYATSFPTAVSGLIVMAPHIRVEEVTVSGIARTQHRYMNGDLRSRLKRYHRDVDKTFFGWAGVWLNPLFQTWNIEADLPALQCRTLAVQGQQDEYGTMHQVDGIAGPGRLVDVVKLEPCGHAPHIDQTDAVIQSVTRFLLRLKR